MTTTSETISAPQAKPGKYLTFRLGQESYGLPVLKVREIIRLVDITPIPQAPACFKGVINLRGKLVPVMDLHIRFSFGATESTDATCIVVVQVSLPAGGILHMGFIVDGVHEVLNLLQNEIQRTPDFGMKVATEYLLGMANVKDRVIALLDIDRVVEKASLEHLASSTASAA